jgi:hypothetical protein
MLMNRLILVSAVILIIAAQALRADEGVRVPPIDHAATLKECGACHLAFPPQMLPARSWDKLMSDLADHFGEDASLEQAVRDDIASYLAMNAADAPTSRGGGRFLKGLADEAVPLRITETPYWKAEHDEIGEQRYNDPKIKSKANCTACHRTADKGEFLEEDD